MIVPHGTRESVERCGRCRTLHRAHAISAGAFTAQRTPAQVADGQHGHHPHRAFEVALVKPSDMKRLGLSRGVGCVARRVSSSSRSSLTTSSRWPREAARTHRTDSRSVSHAAMRRRTRSQRVGNSGHAEACQLGAGGLEIASVGRSRTPRRRHAHTKSHSKGLLLRNGMGWQEVRRRQSVNGSRMAAISSKRVQKSHALIGEIPHGW
jgi:hypothetical protein